MHDLSGSISQVAVDFANRIGASLTDGTFVRLVLSGSNGADAGLDRLIARAVDLKGQLHLSVTWRYATRDQVENLKPGEIVPWALRQLGDRFGNALLCTTRGDWQFIAPHGKKPRLVRHKASVPTAPDREHDQRHRAILDESAHDWLTGLGVTNSHGQVRPGMAAKLAQINRYLEILSHLAKEAGWTRFENGQTPGEWAIADMGCGKGYLTFGLWHLCHQIWSVPAHVVGVECRSELVDNANRLAAAIQADGLQFQSGTIESIQLSRLRGLIALHACDTATDEAIRRGVELGAQLIVVAPCCQKELRPQLGDPAPLAPILSHGIMAERMAEWLTDGLRSLFLQWAGYRTKMFEFVSSEHTPKNIMISAIRERPPFADQSLRTQIIELKAFFGIQHHALDQWLAQAPELR